MKEWQLAPIRRWGQHFLIDPEIFTEIADLVMDGRSFTRVLEIGPGLGGLTLSLLERGAEVAGVEIDGRMKPVLDTLQERYPGKLTVFYEDALAVAWEDILEKVGFAEVDIAGNLPYYATAPLLGRLLDLRVPWQRAVLMVQREVADRLLTEPGHRNTSTLSVLLRYRMEVSSGVEKVLPSSFSPSPAVSSAVIQLRRRPALPVDWETFRWAVRAGFQHRRKMLRQALSRAPGSPLSRDGWQELLPQLAISESARAEELTLAQWVRVCEALMQRKKGGKGRDDL